MYHKQYSSYDEYRRAVHTRMTRPVQATTQRPVSPSSMNARNLYEKIGSCSKQKKRRTSRRANLGGMLTTKCSQAVSWIFQLQHVRYGRKCPNDDRVRHSHLTFVLKRVGPYYENGKVVYICTNKRHPDAPYNTHTMTLIALWTEQINSRGTVVLSNNGSAIDIRRHIFVLTANRTNPTCL